VTCALRILSFGGKQNDAAAVAANPWCQFGSIPPDIGYWCGVKASFFEAGTKQNLARYSASGDQQEDSPMRTLGLAIAAGAILAAAQANAGSFPVNTMTGAASDLVDQVAVRVYVH
jgi:hypothetical protein